MFSQIWAPASNQKPLGMEVGESMADPKNIKSKKQFKYPNKYLKNNFQIKICEKYIYPFCIDAKSVLLLYPNGDVLGL